MRLIGLSVRGKKQSLATISVKGDLNQASLPVSRTVNFLGFERILNTGTFNLIKLALNNKMLCLLNQEENKIRTDCRV